MNAIGEVLTPSVMTSVCPGEQLVLTCNTSTLSHRWTIVDPNTGMMYSRLASVPVHALETIPPLQVQSFTFAFAVISALGTLPLISTLTVNNVTDYLNTSRIGCQVEDGSENSTSEVVNIHVIEPNDTLEGKLKIILLLIVLLNVIMHV